MAAELDGPRREPRSGAAKKLVVFLHGYGADGKDLIEIGRAWQQYLPDAAFVSPHAPEPCAGAPMGRQWFPPTFPDPRRRAPHAPPRGPGAGGFRPGPKGGAAGGGGGGAAPRRDRGLFGPVR